jgi:hypothetical protein
MRATVIRQLAAVCGWSTPPPPHTHTCVLCLRQTHLSVKLSAWYRLRTCSGACVKGSASTDTPARLACSAPRMPSVSWCSQASVASVARTGAGSSTTSPSEDAMAEMQAWSGEVRTCERRAARALTRWRQQQQLCVSACMCMAPHQGRPCAHSATAGAPGGCRQTASSGAAG